MNDRISPSHRTPSYRAWSGYFALQTLMCALWWMGLLMSDEFAALFTPTGASHVQTLRTFWLADIVCVVGGSALSALCLRIAHPLTLQALWWTAGAITFATLYCMAVWIDTQQAWLAVALMVPATCLTLVAARQCTPPISPQTSP